MKRLVLLLLLLPECLLAQDASKRSFVEEIGFWPGFGYGNNRKSLPEGSYKPYFGMFHIAFRPPFKGGHNLLERFQFYLEPQYNHVKISGDSVESNEHEFGLNLGIKYHHPLSRKVDVFMYIGTGPHAFSATTERQAPGYLFSDNMGLGIYYHLTAKWAGIFTFRIRHLSNADTRQPNHGINTDNFHLGISRFF